MPVSTQYAASSRSPSRTSGFTLRTKPGAAGQHRVLAAEVADVPPQHVAEQHRGFVVEVVAGREHVVAVASSAASLNTWRFDSPHAEHGTRRIACDAARDVEAVRRRAGRPRAAASRAARANARA